MLTPSFCRRYRAVPAPMWWNTVAAPLRAWMSGIGFVVDVEHAERLPTRPALLCTNATHRYDFLAVMKALEQTRGARTVTVSKAKNFHGRAQAFVMERTGTVPCASRGYIIAADFVRLLRRRPTDDEYRALRDHVDGRAPLPDTPAFALVRCVPRDVLGHPFDPARTSWRDHVQAVYEAGLAETVRIARTAIDAGMHVQIYPEGTVSRRLGAGRAGAVQLARALGLVVVPIGISGAPDAFFGNTPLPSRGRVVIRIGEPVDLAASLPASHRPFRADDEAAHRPALDAATHELMARIEALVDERHRRPVGALLPGKGVAAFL